MADFKNAMALGTGEESEASSEFEIGLKLAVRTDSDADMIGVRLGCATTMPLGHVGGNGNRGTPQLTC
jgi:hypothetical protein